MKVLWLTSTPAGASKLLNQRTHDRGWIASLGELIKTDSDVDLAVAFFDNSPRDFKFEFDGITYYPMPDKLSTRIGQFKTRFIGKLWDTNLERALKSIEDFKPDLIQIFGTESGMVDILGKTKVPIIIHLQGLINPCLLQWLPKNLSFWSIWKVSEIKKLIMRRDLLSEYRIFKKMARREESAIKKTKYFFGRTEWDKRFVNLFNPDSEYVQCWEALRPNMYENAGKWQNRESGLLKIVTTINPEIYKGLDTLLETAQILSQRNIRFEWSIIGISERNRIVKVIEKGKALRFCNFPIHFLGVQQGDNLILELLKGDLFVHPSHIDNSPNSVCEAMLLGMPVIAAHVGGIPSLIENGYNGLLYNSYDPYDLAGIIAGCVTDRKKLGKLAKNAACTAMERHDRATIVETIKKTYKRIISNNEPTFNAEKLFESER